MKTRALKILMILVVLLIFAESFSSCGKKEIDPIISLKDTKWKLAGIVDTETGVLTELEPKDCEKCYTLTFITNEKAEGWSSLESICIEFSMLGQYNITDIVRSSDEDKFIRALFSQNTTSYSVTSNELRFINQIEKYYLSFKQQ